MFRPDEEVDIKSICRAAMVYYRILQNHCTGNIQLPEDTIKFMTERLLEQTLILEEVAKTVYAELPDEIKQLLDEQEIKRNSSMTSKADGTAYSNIAHEQLMSLKKASNERYENIRKESLERVKLLKDSEI